MSDLDDRLKRFAAELQPAAQEGSVASVTG